MLSQKHEQKAGNGDKAEEYSSWQELSADGDQELKFEMRTINTEIPKWGLWSRADSQVRTQQHDTEGQFLRFLSLFFFASYRQTRRKAGRAFQGLQLPASESVTRNLPAHSSPVPSHFRTKWLQFHPPQPQSCISLWPEAFTQPPLLPEYSPPPPHCLWPPPFFQLYTLEAFPMLKPSLISYSNIS